MKKNRRYFLLILTLLLFITLITGCVKLRTNVSVNKDGSGKVEYVLGMHPLLLGMASQQENPLTEIKNKAKEQGYSVSTFKTQQYAGLKMNKKLDDITNLKDENFFQNISKEMKKPKTKQSNPINASSSPNIKTKKTFFYTTYEVNQNIDLTELATKSKDEFERSMSNSMLSQMDLGLKLNLPVKPVKHNASRVKNEGKTLIWDFIPGEKNEVILKLKVLNIKRVIMTAIIALLIIISGIFVFRKMKKSSVQQNQY